MVYKAFPMPGETAEVLNENDGCHYIALSRPEIGPEKSSVRVTMKFTIRTGAFVMDKCYSPVDWEGYIDVVQNVRIEKDSWTLRFNTVDSRLYDIDRRPAVYTNIVWRLVKKYVHEYLNRITVDLAPSVSELRVFIPTLFPDHLQDKARRIVKTLRPGDIHVLRDAVRADILIDVPYEKEKQAVREEQSLTAAELEKFARIWEAWDSFLVYQIDSIWKTPLSAGERRILLDTLLETRSRFVAKMSGKDFGKDFVREQFVSVWNRLSPIFRRHLGSQPGKNVFGYLVFFTATDALAALDKLGPSLGIEISRNGLLRLARLLNEGKPATLKYDLSVDPKLRKMFDMGAPLDETGPALDKEEIELDPVDKIESDSLSGFFLRYFYGTAFARPKSRASSIREISRWVVTRKNRASYLDKVKNLIRDVAISSMRKKKLDKKYEMLFLRTMLSTAWQESCFRQFRVRKRKITYIRSYNRTSVGIMQINERVWRGMYNLKNLRWDIRYNAMAGGEILELYLRRYALRKMNPKDPINDDILSRIVYAMYNGGPSQFRKFIKRYKNRRLYRSDRLYWEKYMRVKQGRWGEIGDCL